MSEVYPVQAFTMLCQWCLVSAAYGDQLADDYADRDRVAAQLRRLCELVGDVPTEAGWRSQVFRPERLDMDTLPELVTLDRGIPTNHGIYALYDSWLGALAAAELVTGYIRRTTRGIKSLAADGHVCLSVGERTIDDWLTANNVDHTREPPYPGSGMRGDFAVNGVIIEYFGLAGDPAYDAKIEAKRALARTHRLDLLELYRLDIARWETTQNWVADRLGLPPAPPEGRPQAPPVRPDAPRVLTTTTVVPPAPVPAPPPAPRFEPAWRPDPFGVGMSRWHDGRAWTRRVRREDGIEIAHTPTVRRAISDRVAKQVRTERGLQRLAACTRKMFPPIVGRPLPVKPKLMELLYAWMDEHENHIAQEVREYEAMLAAQDPDDPWAVQDTGWRKGPQGYAYSFAARQFDWADRRGAELAVHLRRFAYDSEPQGYWAERIERLTRHGHHPDEVDAGLAVTEPTPELLQAANPG